jgi:hypothetical protein
LSNDQFREVNEKLGRIREAIIHETTYLEALQKQSVISTEKTIKAIGDLLKSQQETELAKSVATVLAKGKQFFEEQKIIETEKTSLDEQIRDIIKNYIEIQTKLDEELESRIRKVGEHIYKIVEEEGENLSLELETSKNEAVDRLSEAINKTYTVKAENLQRLQSGIRSNIESVVKQRELMIQQIQSLLINKPIDRQEKYYVPFWIIEIENRKTKQIEKKILGPSKVSNGHRIEAIKEYDSVLQLFNANLTKVDQVLVNAELGFKSQLISGLDSLVAKGVISRKDAILIVNDKKLHLFEEKKVKELA